MGSESPVIDREEVQSALCQIAEIEAVRVVSDHDNLIQELHVLASGQKAPRQIVRDIESLLMARFGIAVDHKKISIAQINSAAVAAAAGITALIAFDGESNWLEGALLLGVYAILAVSFFYLEG